MLNDIEKGIKDTLMLSFEGMLTQIILIRIHKKEFPKTHQNLKEYIALFSQQLVYLLEMNKDKHIESIDNLSIHNKESEKTFRLELETNNKKKEE
jgi:hypothetical protein